MATTPAKLVIEVVTEAAKARKELESVADSVEDVGKESEGMGKAMAAGAAAGIAGLVALGVQAFNAAEESAKIGRETTRVIASTGAAAWISSQQVSDLASAISDKTGADDEAIQSGANLLLTFTRVRNEVGKGNDVFDQATGLALDMSTALGKDLSSSAIQLGKALNDPVKGMTALSKAGVSFTEQQKDQVKVLAEAGDLLGAQKIILAEVNKEFGGAAEAAGTPLDKLMVKIGNLQEDIGAKLIPAVQTGADILGSAMGPALEKTTALMEENAEAVKFLGSVAFAGLAASMAPAIASGLALVAIPFRAAAGGILFLGQAFTVAATEAGVMSGAMAALNASLLPEIALVAVLGAAIYGFASIFDSSSEAAQDFWKAVHKDVDTSNFQSLAKAARDVDTEIRKLKLERAQSSWRDYGAAIADVLIPLHDVENSLNDQADKRKTLIKLQEDERKVTTDNANGLYLYAQNAVLAAHGIEAYANASVGTTGTNKALADEINRTNDALKAIAQSKKIELTDPEAVARVTALYEATKHTTTSTLDMTEAQKKFNDAASTAKDKVDAYKQSMDALIGVHLSAEQAETNWIKSSVSLVKQFEESNKIAHGAIEVTTGMTLAQTEAVTKNQTAVQSAAKAAMDMAVAKGQESGSYTEATRTLGIQREGLIKVMTQMGVNEEVARNYVNQLGLTPENLQTQMHIDKKQADADLAAYKANLDNVDGTFVAKVVADTGQAEENVRRFLALFRGAVNEARDRALAGTRAAGGPVHGNTPYLVGERGPELFVPRGAGNIVPNYRLGSSSSGGSIVININHTGLAVDSPKLQRDVVAAIRRWQQRNGPI